MLLQKFCDALPSNSAEITMLSRKYTAHSKYNYIQGSLENIDEWWPKLPPIDIFIHAAGLTHSYHATDYFRVNTQYTQVLADKCEAAHIKFVYISTRTAEPNSGGYGLSKLVAEQYIEQHSHNYLILRPAEIFGGIKGEGIDKLIADIQEKNLIPCPMHSDSPMAPIWVGDVVAHMHAYIFDEQYRNQKITINGPEQYTMAEVVALGNKVFSKNATVLPVPKMLLKLARLLVEILQLERGFYPDQVDRLYCKKIFSKPLLPCKSLREYLENSKA